MLITLMSLLNMFGGDVPPTPSDENDADGFLPFEYGNQEDHLRRKRINKYNDELIVIINSFLVCQN